MEEKIFEKIIQARPPALVYWNSEPKLKFKEQRLIVTTGLTFLTVSKVRQEQLVDSLGQITMLTIWGEAGKYDWETKADEIICPNSE